MPQQLFNLLGLGSVFIRPAQAHKTQVSGDVAGIWHLEPNHSPKAGEPAQVWIALTQAGGRVIPLRECDCRLTVYAGDAVGTTPLLEPILEAIAAEQYQGIPGATVTFPAAGQYHLHLEGKPQAGATFQPFEMSYTVTVAVGSTTAGSTQTSTPVSPSHPQPIATPNIAPTRPDSWLVSPTLYLGTGGVLLGLLLMLFLRRQHRPPKP
ncbi:hypothetical protein [Trichothermofontia sp.]